LLDLARSNGIGQGSVLATLLVAVIVLDQATKWWGWRHVPDTIINTGGDWIVGNTIGAWYEDSFTGKLLDILDAGIVTVAVSILARGRRPAGVLISGALMMGGWGSNLLDRLGMHHLTAPGSSRGAVDFIQIGDETYNVADFVIGAATLMFLLALCFLGWQATDRSEAHPKRHRARISTFAGAACVVAVLALRAASYSG
jgi:lipoprotein signal peptidase